MRREWRVTALGPEKLGIECPWCDEKAVVRRAPWLLMKAEFIGRSCTYCFGTAGVPDRFRLKHKRGR